MKVGDEVTFKKPHYAGPKKVQNATKYTIIEITDEFLKLKHPEISGHFVFGRDLVDKVIPNNT